MTIKLFATDLDGTLLGQADALGAWRRAWNALPQAQRPGLCYTSGRMQDDILRLIAEGTLPQPDYIIGGVGTSIYDIHSRSLLKEFAEILEEGWNLETVEITLAAFSDRLTRQPVHFQHDFKSSWYLPDAAPAEIAALEAQLEAAGLDVHVVYSSGLHLDVLPKWANKGNALRWLLRHLELNPAEVIVAGDSGNDSAMFLLPGVKGIVVGNAQPELYRATKHLPIFHAETQQVCATAVIAGLQHYGVFDESVEISEEDGRERALQDSLQYLGDEPVGSLTLEQLELIRQGYHKAIEALKKNVTPLGFSACSLDDNETTGTDANYRSVWARDGSITLIGSLPLMNQDEELRACQRQTLVTLLEHTSPSGQIPANVRIDDQRPDYSGVGGIASIDSGLWVIIAFYAYIQHTKDLDFLRERISTLQEVMDWLSAHDSNNDALLEIPEAGDWTDLFGRSYNVLYDEVLWYRVNICFGRLLELVGDGIRAGDYFRWARIIKREIQENFWPSTQQRTYDPVSFAERQYTIGDVRYLIAQITPFDYSWRCDTLGNVMAYLYDVIDGRRAEQTFRFLWGVGVNEPYPIANLYPAVMAGDPDWRSYYTVNLLNLPYHYHNGGIWPFVGGMWVRYVNKLGLRDLALQELYNLARLNRLGVANEWEFNEWVHGRTGRPMGKAYQAWSASEYILACHHLNVVAG